MELLFHAKCGVESFWHKQQWYNFVYADDQNDALISHSKNERDEQSSTKVFQIHAKYLKLFQFI